VGKRNRRRVARQRAAIATHITGTATFPGFGRTVHAVTLQAVSFYYQWNFDDDRPEQLCPGPPLGGRWP
jgi:hypothetical protein